MTEINQNIPEPRPRFNGTIENDEKHSILKAIDHKVVGTLPYYTTQVNGWDEKRVVTLGAKVDNQLERSKIGSSLYYEATKLAQEKGIDTIIQPIYKNRDVSPLLQLIGASKDIPGMKEYLESNITMDTENIQNLISNKDISKKNLIDQAFPKEISQALNFIPSPTKEQEEFLYKQGFNRTRPCSGYKENGNGEPNIYLYAKRI